MKKHGSLIGALLVVTIIFGTIDVTVQQSLRLSANDPQIQMAEDAATSSSATQVLSSLPSGHVDMRTSLAPFIIVYDEQGNALGGNGYLDGSTPRVPTGVLRAADSKPYNFVSWQPDPDVRIAAVSVAANGYYVLSGRNLREVEHRENLTICLVGFGWLCSIFVVLAVAFVLRKQAIKSAKR